jgi:hypothetical protein
MSTVLTDKTAEMRTKAVTVSVPARAQCAGEKTAGTITAEAMIQGVSFSFDKTIRMHAHPTMI